MNKITVFLVSILFALSILGCATSQDKAKWDEQSRDTMKSQGQNPGVSPGP
jgi:preprotein translocase subunit SecG